MTTESARPVGARRLLGDRVARPSANRSPARSLSAVRSAVTLESVILVLVLGAALGARVALEPWRSGDFGAFLEPWFAYLQTHGFAGLGDAFADYNVPYLYLLYIGTLLPVDALMWVKALGLLADIALALGCANLARSLGLSKHVAILAGVGALLLPEVVLNSAAWGQADSLYCSFLVWALAAAVRGRGTASWVLFAFAFTFKLQAAFVLPVFVVAHVMHRWRFRSIGIAVLAALATEIPALIAGRSPLSLASIYVNQTGGYTDLSLNAPTMYLFLPAWTASVTKSAGVLFAVAVVGMITYVVLTGVRRGPVPPRLLVLAASTVALTATYTLPMMHERYFYLGNVLLFVWAILDRRFLPLAFVSQAVAVLAYSPFLLQTQPAVPMAHLALVEGAIVLTMLYATARAFHPVRTGDAAVNAPTVLPSAPTPSA